MKKKLTEDQKLLINKLLDEVQDFGFDLMKRYRLTNLEKIDFKKIKDGYKTSVKVEF